MSYIERLKFLKLIPLSRYFELHDILYLVSLRKSRNDIDLNTIFHKNESHTRQATRGEIAIQATRRKSQMKIFMYVLIRYTIILAKLSTSNIKIMTA